MSAKEDLTLNTKKIKVPLSFILIICGVILITVNWMPFIGWIYVLMSFMSAFVSLTLKSTKKGNKTAVFILVIIMIFLISLMVFSSFPVFKDAFIKTFIDVQNLFKFFA